MLALCLTLVSCATKDAHQATQVDPEIVNAPRSIVGTRIEDWVEYLGFGYEIDEVRGLKNRHSGEPNAILKLSRGATSVTFQVDLVRNRHYLFLVETSSLELIEHLGIELDQLSPKRTYSYQDCGESGCSTLLLEYGKRSASAFWTYHWD